MAVPERDSTQEWMLPEERRPPLIGELEERIDEALATARSSEAAVISVGAAALDAAEQARRAAELAERAAASAAEASSRAGQAVSMPPAARPAAVRRPPQPLPPPAAGNLGDFDARADRLMERLQRLQRVPLGPTNPAATPPQAQP